MLSNLRTHPHLTPTWSVYHNLHNHYHNHESPDIDDDDTSRSSIICSFGHHIIQSDTPSTSRDPLTVREKPGTPRGVVYYRFGHSSGHNSCSAQPHSHRGPHPAVVYFIFRAEPDVRTDSPFRTSDTQTCYGSRDPVHDLECVSQVR